MRKPIDKSDKDQHHQQAVLKVIRPQAAKKIQKQIDEGEEILQVKPRNDAELEQFRDKKRIWSDYNKELLKTLFNTSEIADEYSAFVGGAFSMNPSFFEKVDYVKDDIQNKLTRLRSIFRRIELFPLSDIANEKHEENVQTIHHGNDIFLVHGHNNEIKETVARFLEKLKLHIIILHEQPNLGRTIIEKFEDYSKVGYAVILLTGDDVGSKKDNADKLKARARQNVVLEQGYFLGALGRSRVCALYEEGVEIPSDLSGVLYVPLDSEGAWKLKLASEMKAAGIEIDLNLAI
ncbi:MAG: nucleotide-binding protein [Elusimicrobiota bacterium]